MDEENTKYAQLKEFVLQQGASLFGVARTSSLPERFFSITTEVKQGLYRIISIAFHLSDRILEDLINGPTKLYFFHYQRVNVFLDEAGLKVTSFIQDHGWDALPIPASQIVDWERQRGHVSHKHAAEQAGLGWIGRNNLLVNPRFGSRVRLVTILTNMPLKVDAPLPFGCHDCYACLSSCPARSIKERPEDFDHLGCYQQIKALVKAAGISQNVCGLCMKACLGKR
jgi:epoxyqueuosine reductase